MSQINTNVANVPNNAVAVSGCLGDFKPEHQKAFTWESISHFAGNSWGPILYQVSVAMPMVLCSYLIGSFGEAFALSVFGLGNTFVNLAFNGFLWGLSENLGVHASKYFAQGNHRAIRALLGKFLVLLVLLVILTLILFETSESILLFFGFEKAVAQATYQLMHASRWYVLLLAFNFPTVSFLISQQIVNPLIYINAVTMTVVWVSGHFFIVTLNLKEMGFPWARLCQELAGAFCYAYLLWRYSERRVFHGFSLSDILADSTRYLQEILVTISNFYSELVCFEVNIYFIGLLHNLTQIALWITLMNSAGTVFNISIAFSNTIRTQVARLVGLRKAELARSESIHMFIYMAFFAYAFTMLLSIFKYQIGWIFTGNEYLTEQMASIYFVYCFNIFPTLTLYSCNTILRILDNQALLFRINTIYNVVITLSMSYVFCFVFDLKTIGVNIAFMISKTIIVIYTMYQIYYKIDWRTASGVLSGNLSLELIREASMRSLR